MSGARRPRRRRARPDGWIEVTQERIDAFAAATDDPQWIHVDPERAAEGPFGTHDRARLPHALALRTDALRGAPPTGGDGVNYGVEPRALPGSGAVGRPDPRTVPCARSIEATVRGARATIEATVECDGVDKPVCVAELVVLTVS